MSANRLANMLRGIEVTAGASGARLDRNVVDHAAERGVVLAAAGPTSDAPVSHDHEAAPAARARGRSPPAR